MLKNYIINIIHKESIAYFLFLLYIVSRLNFIVFFGSNFGIYIYAAVIISLIYILSSFEFNKFDILFYILFFWMIGIYLFRILTEVEVVDENNINQFDLTANTIGNIVIYYTVGRFFGKHNLFRYVTRQLRLLFFIFLISLLQFTYFSIGTLTVDYDAISQRMHGGWVSHLDFGATLILLSFIILSSLTGKTVLKFLFIIINIYLLFIAGGRSAFLVYFITLYLIWIDSLGKNAIALKILFISVPLSAISWVFYLIFLDDPSFVDRVNIFLMSFNFFGDQLFFGDPIKILSYGENYGSYIHNILGAVQLFGIPMLIGVIVLIGGVTTRLFSTKISQNSKYQIFIKLILIYSLVSLLLTKFISEWLLWFSLGVCVSYISSVYNFRRYKLIFR